MEERSVLRTGARNRAPARTTYPTSLFTPPRPLAAGVRTLDLPPGRPAARGDAAAGDRPCRDRDRPPEGCTVAAGGIRAARRLPQRQAAGAAGPRPRHRPLSAAPRTPPR